MVVEKRQYTWRSGYGRWLVCAPVHVECRSERGKFYAAMNTLNASPIGVGDTAGAAFSEWEKRCGVEPVWQPVQGAI